MPPKKPINKSEELFNVNGLSIKKNAVYKIENRFDPTAPSGFQKEGATKLPSTSVGNTVYCPYTENVWDTGLYEFSPCYRGETQAIVTEKLKMLQEHVIKPFEKKMGKSGILTQDNEDFWNDYKVEIWAGRYLNTGEPEDMLQLYLAMMAGEICPENDKGNPRYNAAAYVVVDKAKERTTKQKKAVSTIDAIGQFYVLLSENPQKLINILKYIGVANISDKVESDTIKTMFNMWLDRDVRNPEIFIELVESSNDKGFEEVIYLHSTIKKMSEAGKISKNSVGDYVYNGIPLGKDLKTVAKSLVQSPDLLDVKVQICEEFAK